MKFKMFVLSLILLFVFAGTAFAASADSQSTSVAGAAAQNGDQIINQVGAGNLRGFAIPGTMNYAPMPNEFLNDTQFANVQPVKFILQFGCVYNKIHLSNMKSDGSVNTIQLINLYGNVISPEDTAQIEFLTEVPKDKKLFKVGSIISKSRTGNTTTEQVLADVGLQALTMKNAKYVLISGEGMQKSTSTFGVGIALGYTRADIGSADQTNGSVATAGIGVSYGNAGRQADAFIHGVVLTDEAGYKELTAQK